MHAAESMRFGTTVSSAIAREARDALRRHDLEPLVPRCIDREYGGQHAHEVSTFVALTAG